MQIISIDGGTTNMRISLIDDGRVVFRVKQGAGAGNTSHDGLKSAIKDGIGKILSQNEGAKPEIITVSGMLTSGLGLYELAHINAASGISELAKGAKKIRFDDITDTDFLIIPGIKCHADICEKTDMMRGEETEFFGMCKGLSLDKNVLAVLPGSHTKLVCSDEGNNITECFTTLGGEMLAAIRQNTILKNSLPDVLPKEYNKKTLIDGYNAAKKYGVNNALFKVRVLDTLHGYDSLSLYSFYVGALLSSDIMLVKENLNERNVIIGGSEPLCSIFAELISYETGKNVHPSCEEIRENAVAYGAWEIYKKYKEMA